MPTILILHISCEEENIEEIEDELIDCVSNLNGVISFKYSKKTPQKAALNRINAWRKKNDLSPLRALPDLGTHCEQCGSAFERKDLDGGRCLVCGQMICAAPTLERQQR